MGRGGECPRAGGGASSESGIAKSQLGCWPFPRVTLMGGRSQSPRQSLWASSPVIIKPTQGGGGCSGLDAEEPLAQEGFGDKGPGTWEEMQQRVLAGTY